MTEQELERHRAAAIRAAAIRALDNGAACGEEAIEAFVAEVRRLRALTTCACGRERQQGPCCGNCDRDD